MNPFLKRMYALLRWSQKYTHIDMVYATRSGFWVNANFVTVSAFSLLLSVGFANFLTKETYGTYQYLFSLYAILTAFTLTGMNAAITRAVARGYSKTLITGLRPQILWNLFPAIAALAIATYYFFAGNATIALGLVCMAAALPLYNAFNSYTAYLSGTENFRGSFLYACAVNIPYYFCMFAGIYFLKDALALVFINLFVNTCITIINYRQIAKRIPKESPTDPEAISYGKELTYANLFSTAASQVDNLLVFHFLGATELAGYALIKLIPERLGGVFKAILGPAFPRLANRTTEEIGSTIIHRSLLMGLAALSMAIVYAVLAFPLFSFLYPAYKNYAIYSAVYGLTLFVAIGNFGITALMAQKRTRALYALNSFVPFIQLLLQGMGLYFWSLWGLVLAKLLGVLLMNTLVIAIVRAPSKKP